MDFLFVNQPLTEDQGASSAASSSFTFSALDFVDKEPIRKFLDRMHLAVSGCYRQIKVRTVSEGENKEAKACCSTP